MSILQPSLLTLDKGLNLQTAKIVAPAGSVLDSLNYEQVDFQGQKRIDGYVRYDGGLGSYIDEYYLITTDGFNMATVGESIFVQDADLNKHLIGVLVAMNGFDYTVVIIDENYIPTIQDELFLQSFASIGTVSNIQEGKDIHAVDIHYNNLLDYNAELRSRTEGLPGPVAGLHWFRDRLYAVASSIVVVLTPGPYSPDIKLNDILQTNGTTATVLYVENLLDSSYIVLDAASPEEWYVSGQEAFKVSTGESLGNIDSNPLSETAQLYQSRTEQQAGTELINYDAYGWAGIHLGWSVPFEEGISLYGSLPSLNQNIQDIGIQGPTSIAGGNGRALSLTQKVVIDGQEEVNGWKGSNTPTTYSLDVENIKEIDALSIYADAYITWDGDSGSVDAPGAQNPPLAEYSPTNTVKVSVA